jgi:hypothetical protein
VDVRGRRALGFLTDVFGPALLLGIGMGAVLNATTNAASAGLPPQQAGLASGPLNTTRQWAARSA